MINFFGSKAEELKKTIGVKSEFDTISATALLWQGIYGQQVLNPNWTWKKYYFHQLAILLLFIYVFFGTLDCLNISDDIEVVTEAWYTLIMIAIFPIKMLLFIHNRVVFRKLYLCAKTTLLNVIKADDGVNIFKVLKTAKDLVNVLLLIIIIPAAVYEIATLWNYLQGKRTLLSRSTTTLMPMITPYHELAWFLHTVFLLEMASTVILDMWFILLIHFWCLTNDSLTKILMVALRTDESNASYAKRLNDSLRKFYNTHVKQMEYLNALNKMYNWLGFVPLCNAAMCTCLILLLISKGINWKFAPHFLPMFAEIFAYNWFGEQIKTKTKNLHLALIYFDWTNMELKNKKNYYIILTYMEKKFGINTAVGIELSLITMTSVLKISYQTFTVLQTIE